MMNDMSVLILILFIFAVIIALVIWNYVHDEHQKRKRTPLKQRVPHFEPEIDALFSKYVPANGQAKTVNGELVRSLVRLSDEAYRNGNGNWDQGYLKLANYLKNTLTKADIFSEDEKDQIKADIAQIKKHQSGTYYSDSFGRLADKVLEWSASNPKAIPRELDPTLKR